MEKSILNIKSFFKVILLSVILFSRLIAGPFDYSQSTIQGFYFFINPISSNDVYNNEAFGIEAFSDENNNNQWDEGEEFTDAGNGVWDEGEEFTDAGNGVWDEGEEFIDSIDNGVYDEDESFTDLGNGVYDLGESFIDIGNGVWDNNNDWIGAYRCLEWQDGVCVNVGKCVGARLWDKNTCGGGICEVPVQGDDGSDYSDGYMLPGEVPVFRMYIESTDNYYDVTGITLDDGTAISPSDVSGWQNFSFFSYGNIEALINGCTDNTACNYDSSANQDDGSCLFLDCNEECGGVATIDDCGVCGGSGIAEGTCDCDGNVEDCSGQCGGNALLDCNGECGGDALTDSCGNCVSSEDELCAFSAYIANPTADVGDVVQVPITFLSNNLPIGSIDFDIIFDSSMLDDESVQVDCSNGPFSSFSAQYNVSTILETTKLLVSLSTAGNDVASQGGLICRIDFEIISGSEETDVVTPLTFSQIDVNGIDFLDSSTSGEILINQIILGCTDESACNFNVNSNNDDGSCIFSEQNYDCEGNCVADVDCAGECGGVTTVDECGKCGGNCDTCDVTDTGIDPTFFNCLGDCQVDVDCAGECGGSALEDECGVCNGPGLQEFDEEDVEASTGQPCDCNGSVWDCDGKCVLSPTFLLDSCGTCDDEPSNDCTLPIATLPDTLVDYGVESITVSLDILNIKPYLADTNPSTEEEIEFLDVRFNFDSSVLELESFDFTKGFLSGYGYTALIDTVDSGTFAVNYIANDAMFDGFHEDENPRLGEITFSVVGELGTGTALNFQQFMINDQLLSGSWNNGYIGITSVGCMDQAACNYDNLAEVNDDLLCEYYNCDNQCYNPNNPDFEVTFSQSYCTEDITLFIPDVAVSTTNQVNNTISVYIDNPNQRFIDALSFTLEPSNPDVIQVLSNPGQEGTMSSYCDEPSFSFDFFNKTVSVDILNCNVPLSDDLPLFKINVIVPSGTFNESGLFIPTEIGSSTLLEFTHLSISSLYDDSVFDLSDSIDEYVDEGIILIAKDSYSFSGSVTNYDLDENNELLGVEDATLTLIGSEDQSNTFQVQSDDDGSFTFQDVGPDNYILVPSRSADDSQLNVSQAFKISYFTLGLLDFSSGQRLAANVSDPYDLDAVISSMDASRLARQSAGEVEYMNTQNTNWIFYEAGSQENTNYIDIPLSRLSSLEESSVNITGYRLGNIAQYDCSLNNDCSPIVVEHMNGVEIPYSFDQITGSISTGVLNPGGEAVTFNLDLNNLSSISSLESIDISMAFDTNLLSIDAVRLDGENFDDYQFLTNLYEPPGYNSNGRTANVTGELNISIFSLIDPNQFSDNATIEFDIALSEDWTDDQENIFALSFNSFLVNDVNLFSNSSSGYAYASGCGDLICNDGEIYAEVFIDTNINGVWDEGEEFTDLGNGVWDEGEELDDINGNGIWDEEEAFVDLGNGIWDDACGDCIQGCTDQMACNYDESLQLQIYADDGSCEYPEGYLNDIGEVVNENIYDCLGSCIVDFDCSGECGGSLVADDCGVCNGNNLFDSCSGDDLDCNCECTDGTPLFIEKHSSDTGDDPNPQYGLAIVDDCNVCSGGNTNHAFNSDMDCAGECYGGAVYNACWECNILDDSTCNPDIQIGGPGTAVFGRPVELPVILSNFEERVENIDIWINYNSNVFSYCNKYDSLGNCVPDDELDLQCDGCVEGVNFNETVLFDSFASDDDNSYYDVDANTFCNDEDEGDCTVMISVALLAPIENVYEGDGTLLTLMLKSKAQVGASSDLEITRFQLNQGEICGPSSTDCIGRNFDLEIVNHFAINLESTSVGQEYTVLSSLQNALDNLLGEGILSSNDEIGIFDYNGVSNDGLSCEDRDVVLVGRGTFVDDDGDGFIDNLDIPITGSTCDQSISNGYIQDNPVIIKYWDLETNIEYFLNPIFENPLDQSANPIFDGLDRSIVSADIRFFEQISLEPTEISQSIFLSMENLIYSDIDVGDEIAFFDLYGNTEQCNEVEDNSEIMVGWSKITQSDWDSQSDIQVNMPYGSGCIDGSTESNPGFISGHPIFMKVWDASQLKMRYPVFKNSDEVSIHYFSLEDIVIENIEFEPSQINSISQRQNISYDDEEIFISVSYPYGQSTEITLSSSIISLDDNDQIAIIDKQGLMNYGTCSSNIEYGRLIVGAATFNSTLESVVFDAVGAVDNCSSGGIILPGYQLNNYIHFKVWDDSNQTERYMKPIFLNNESIASFNGQKKTVTDLQSFHFDISLDETSDNKSVFIFDQSISILENGDEVGIFSSGYNCSSSSSQESEVLVGRIMWNSVEDSPFTFAIGSSSSGECSDGYIEGEEIVFYVWKDSEQKEYLAKADLFTASQTTFQHDFSYKVLELDLIDCGDTVCDEDYGESFINCPFDCPLVEDLQSSMSDDGVITETVEFGAEDNSVSVTVDPGTVIYINGEAYTSEEPLEISISAYSGDIETPESITLDGDILAMEPFGLSFSDPVTISLSYDQSLLARKSSSLNVVKLDIDEDTWQIVENASCDELGSCTADINQFGLFGVAEIDLEDESFIAGCMDTSSSNYNPNAVVDDQSCIYEPDYTTLSVVYPSSEETYLVSDGDIEGQCPLPLEEFTDTNQNGVWDSGEPFVDSDGDNTFDQDYSECPTFSFAWNPLFNTNANLIEDVSYKLFVGKVSSSADTTAVNDNNTAIALQKIVSLVQSSTVYTINYTEMRIKPGVNQTYYWFVQPVIDGEFIDLVDVPSRLVKFFVDATSLSNEEINLPTSFSLNQNFPNPFNPTTNISFSLPYPENINISVFDLSGRKVQQLVDGFYLPGNHVIKWDGSGYNGNTVASGIYIYQLTGPNLLITRKMLLLK